ncbi:MAG: DNA alkylation repair protein [Nanoarchaeota archaeon]|nr:DNA alkylation repair protein [Nanoarchaeota archaeon]
MKIDEILNQYKNPEKAKILQRFFKTGKGEYGEGDIFLGLTMGQNRDIAKKFSNLDFESIQELLDSEIHEKRMIGLLILVDKFKDYPTEVYDFYLKNAKKINNWDLVDLTSHKIVGKFLLDKPRDILYDLVKSENLWEKRIAIISTYAFIREGEFEDTLKIAEILLGDKHALKIQRILGPRNSRSRLRARDVNVSPDLIHKGVGWMLREVGKKNQEVLEGFLKKHYKKMPRTMLRYSIERFDEELRQKYLKGEV